jgi:hypothetical protein
MNCSIVIPSDSISIEPAIVERQPKKMEEDEFPLWRSVVYEFWSESDIYTDIILQLDVLHTEYIFANYTLQKVCMSWPQFKERKKSIMEGITILNKRGYFSRNGHHLTSISFYFSKLSIMSRDDFENSSTPWVTPRRSFSKL